MSRTLSTTATTAILSQQTDQTFLLLLEIDHADMPAGEPFRLVNNYEDVTSGGDDYTAYPFAISLPRDTGDRPPEVPVTVDNVDRLLIEAVRSVATPPTVSLSVCLASQPDTIEAGPFGFNLRSVEYDVTSVTGKLTYESILDEPFPAQTMTPSRFPGIFGGVPDSTTWDPGDRDLAAGAGFARGWPADSPYGKRRRR